MSKEVDYRCDNCKSKIYRYLWLVSGKHLCYECYRDHIERFNPVITELSHIVIPSQVLFIQIKRHNPSSTRITDATIVEDLMVHDIDLLSHSLGLNITP